MKITRMKVIFVDDIRPDIDAIMSILATSKYFDVRDYRQFSDITEQSILDADLFVLDVRIGESDVPFCDFIMKLRRLEKPFIAYTKRTEHSRLPLPGEPQLRRVIFQNGGIGMVEKLVESGSEARVTRGDIMLDLTERVMNFYWAWRTSKRDESI